MVILDNSRALGLRAIGYCIFKILFLYLHQINNLITN